MDGYPPDFWRWRTWAETSCACSSFLLLPECGLHTCVARADDGDVLDARGAWALKHSTLKSSPTIKRNQRIITSSSSLLKIYTFNKGNAVYFLITHIHCPLKFNKEPHPYRRCSGVESIGLFRSTVQVFALSQCKCTFQDLSLVLLACTLYLQIWMMHISSKSSYLTTREDPAIYNSYTFSWSSRPPLWTIQNIPRLDFTSLSIVLWIQNTRYWLCILLFVHPIWIGISSLSSSSILAYSIE